MFDASRMWLASRGMEAMDGPINFGQRDAWWGLLVEGYEFQPLYENPYNPPYYKELFENYGFRNYFNQNTYIWKIYDDDVNAMVHDRAKRLFSTPGYGFRQIDMSRIEEEAENFRIIYNKAWSLFSGVKPMTQEEAMKIMETMKPIIDPEIIFFAYFNDEPIGFFIMVPRSEPHHRQVQRQIRTHSEAADALGPESPQGQRPHFSASSSASRPNSTARASSRA